MKILFLNKYNYVHGGSDVYMFNLIDELEKNGHEIIRFSMKDELNEKSVYEDYFVDGIDYSSGGMNKVKNAINLISSKEAYDKLCKLIEDTKPDVAHVNLIYHQLTPSVLHALKKYNIPIVYVAHDYKIICPNYKLYSNDEVCRECYGGKFYKCTTKKCHKNSYVNSFILTLEAYYHKFKKSYKLVDTIIAPSDFVEKELLLAGYDKTKVVKLKNFLTQEYSILDFKVNKGNYFLFYGRLSKEKGVLNILKVMNELKDTKPNIKLKIVGTGKEEKILKEFVRNNNLKNVDFLGFKKGDELKELIINSTATIQAAIWEEVFGLTVIESFALGKPVIGSARGGIKENISDGITGYVFNPNNLEEFKNCIEKMSDLSELEYEKMQKACIEKSKEFSKEEYTKRIEKLYLDLIRGKKS